MARQNVLQLKPPVLSHILQFFSNAHSGLIETSNLFQRMLPILTKASVATGASTNVIGQATEWVPTLSPLSQDIQNNFAIRWVRVNKKGNDGTPGKVLQASQYILDLPNIVQQTGRQKDSTDTLQDYVYKKCDQKSVAVGVLVDTGCGQVNAADSADGTPVMVVGFGASNNKKSARLLAAQSVLNHRSEIKKELLRLFLK